MLIRRAEPRDKEWCVAAGKRLSDHYGSKHIFWSSEEAAGELFEALSKNIFLVAENTAGHRVGLIAGVYTPHYFIPGKTIATCALWWVDPDARKSGIGTELIRSFVENAKHTAQCIVMAMSHDAYSDESMNGLGFQFLEKSYILEV